MSKLHKNIYIAMLVAQGVIIGLIENMIPYPFAFAPGAKLGLANLITIIAIFTMRKRDSFPGLFTFDFNDITGRHTFDLFYSASGALLSYFGMLLVKQLGPKRVSIIGISAVGGFLHNVGQLLTTSFFAHSWAPMLYLPFYLCLGYSRGLPLGLPLIIYYNMSRRYENSN